MIVALVAPALIAGIVWMVWSLTPPPPGSPEAMRAFQRQLQKSYNPSDMEFHARNCFVIGSPANRYQEVLAKANLIERPGHHYKAPTATAYHFWCEGKQSANEADHIVVVLVGGTPPEIVHAETNGYTH